MKLKDFQTNKIWCRKFDKNYSFERRWSGSEWTSKKGRRKNAKLRFFGLHQKRFICCGSWCGTGNRRRMKFRKWRTLWSGGQDRLRYRSSRPLWFHRIKCTVWNWHNALQVGSLPSVATDSAVSIGSDRVDCKLEFHPEHPKHNPSIRRSSCHFLLAKHAVEFTWLRLSPLFDWWPRFMDLSY